MTKAVIFDMDGVLVNSEPKSLEQLEEFYESYGAYMEKEDLIRLVGSSFEHTYKESMRVLKKDWTLETFQNEIMTYAKAHPLKYDEIINPGVREILVWLKANGYQTAIASSSLIVQIQQMLSECELDGMFDVVLSGEMFEESKPNPEIYITAARKLHVDPIDCLVIEDSTYGIAAGKAAGMKVLAYRDRHFHIDQSQADVIIDSMEEIPNYVK